MDSANMVFQGMPKRKVSLAYRTDISFHAGVNCKMIQIVRPMGITFATLLTLVSR